MQIKLKRKYYMPQVVSFPLKKYPDKLSSTCSAVEKCVCPTSLLIYLHFLHIYHTCMFQIIKQSLILDKDSLRKCKMQYLNADFI